MRIQILELPTVVDGDDVTTPFAVVFDKLEIPAEGDQGERMANFTHAIGASGFFATPEVVEIVDPFQIAEVEEVRAFGEQHIHINHAIPSPDVTNDIISRLKNL